MANNQPETLREMREAAGLSQTALCALLATQGSAISQQRLSEYEKGERFPGPDNVMALATALGITPERMFSALLAQRVA